MSAPMIDPVNVTPAFFSNIGIRERLVEKTDLFEVLGDFCQIIHLKLGMLYYY